MKKVLFLLACVVAMMLPAQAQRLISKQKGIEVVGSLPIIKGEKLFAKDNFGLSLSLTRYLKRENYTLYGIGVRTAEYAVSGLWRKTQRCTFAFGLYAPAILGQWQERVALWRYLRFGRL